MGSKGVDTSVIASEHVSQGGQPLGKLPPVSLLVTDLDNTLWDWVEIWYRSFTALLDGIVRISQIPAAELVPDIRRIHQRRRTAEYAYLIGELEPLIQLHKGADLQELYRDAIDAARTARERALELYPGVSETIAAICERGTVIAGYTESLAFQAAARVKRLGLDGFLDYLYSPADHEWPDGVTPAALRRLQSEEYYHLNKTIHRHTPPGHLKPEADVLESIVAELSDGDGVVYVGDSKMKDIVMAQSVGVTDVWAKYGVRQSGPEYELLKTVTHWTDEDVEREKRIAEHGDVTPTITLHKSFAQLLDHFDFVKNDRR